jgi:hypothetical protein
MLKSDAKSRSSGAGSFGRLRINPFDKLRTRKCRNLKIQKYRNFK